VSVDPIQSPDATERYEAPAIVERAKIDMPLIGLAGSVQPCAVFKP